MSAASGDDDLQRDAEPWWISAFGADYQELYAHRDDVAAEAEVAGVAGRLAEAPGPLLDACCGNGRHLAALRRRGIDAWGFDYSEPLIAAAARRAECAGRVCRADLRQLPFGGGWGAITLFFTAFGYFDEATNAAVLRELGLRLAAGGWLLLDLPDPVALEAGLVPLSRRLLPDRRVVEERRRIAGRRVEKQVRIAGGTGALQEYVESVRLYGRDELAELGAGAGLQLVEVWPSLEGPRAAGDRQVVWLRRR